MRNLCDCIVELTKANIRSEILRIILIDNGFDLSTAKRLKEEDKGKYVRIINKANELGLEIPEECFYLFYCSGKIFDREVKFITPKFSSIVSGLEYTNFFYSDFTKDEESEDSLDFDNISKKFSRLIRGYSVLQAFYSEQTQCFAYKLFQNGLYVGHANFGNNDNDLRISKMFQGVNLVDLINRNLTLNSSGNIRKNDGK